MRPKGPAACPTGNPSVDGSPGALPRCRPAGTRSAAGDEDVVYVDPVAHRRGAPLAPRGPGSALRPPGRRDRGGLRRGQAHRGRVPALVHSPPGRAQTSSASCPSTRSRSTAPPRSGRAPTGWSARSTTCTAMDLCAATPTCAASSCPTDYAEGHPLRKDFPLRGRFSRAEQTRRALTQQSRRTTTLPGEIAEDGSPSWLRRRATRDGAGGWRRARALATPSAATRRWDPEASSGRQSR